ncbi:hypothetical protein [Mesoaciditoga lauensis]|uniref:hypothetical protein n=1 Tax=Mesoaciditoga lauensis TaxID=1495039 RepID=UPI0005608122|nr:hypothetical protein [Mesoaciditoga lauensis]
MKARSKLLLVVVSAFITALLLSGCFMLPTPKVYFTAPSSAYTYPANSNIKFAWTANQEVTYTLTLTSVNSTPVTWTLLKDSTATSFEATIATPGVYKAEITAKNSMGAKDEDTVQFNVTSIKFLNTTNLYGKSTVNIQWESVDGKNYTYLYSIDGNNWTETTTPSATLMKLKDGNYTFQVKIKNSLVPTARYKFEVLTAGPSLNVLVNNREFSFGEGSHPQGREALLSWTSDQGNLLSQIYIKFYKYVKDPTTGLYVRRRMAIDPTTDTWEMLPATATFKDQPGYIIDATKYNAMVVSADSYAYVKTPGNYVKIYDMSGNQLYIPPFELGSINTIIWFPINSFGNMGDYTWALFTLSERYGKEDEPEMYVSYDKMTVATDSNFTAEVKVPNVVSYSNGTHEITNDNVDKTDITSNDGLMYMQFSLAIAPGLQINSVTFPDMEKGKVNLTHYTYDATNGILTVYRGFVDPTSGATVAQSATDIAVEVNCTVPATYTKTYAYVGLIYEGDFRAEGYKNLNPIFKDNSNMPIDGIVTSPIIWAINVGSQTK